MACNHQQTTQHWVVDSVWNEDDSSEHSGHWEYGDSGFTCVDIDLHRYKCTQCGEVMYYSSAASNLNLKKEQYRCVRSK